MYGFLGPSWVLITYKICPPRNRRERERRVRITINDGGGKANIFALKANIFAFRRISSYLANSRSRGFSDFGPTCSYSQTFKS